MSNEEQQEPTGDSLRPTSEKRRVSSGESSGASSKRKVREFDPTRAGEYIVNSLLRDQLKRNDPPDFLSRILTKLDARVSGITPPPSLSLPSPSYTSDELDEALGAAQADIEFGNRDGASQESETRSTHRAKRRRPIPDRIRVNPRPWEFRWVRRVAALATLAASMVGIWFVYREGGNLLSPQGQLAHNGADPSNLDPSNLDAGKTDPTPLDYDNSLVGRSQSGAGASGPEREPDAGRNSTARSSTGGNDQLDAKIASIPTLPSETSAALSSDTHDRAGQDSIAGQATDASDSSGVQPPQTGKAFESIANPEANNPREGLVRLPQPDAMEQSDIISIIDSQIQLIWEQASISGVKRVDDQAWLDRASAIAIGRGATSAEQEAFRLDTSSGRTQNAIERLLASEEFTKNWGRLLSEHYLGYPIPSVRIQPFAVQQFIAWVEEGVRADRPIQDLEAAMATARVSREAEPAGYWFQETLNRELLVANDRERNSRMKFPYDSIEAPFVGVASTLLHRSGVETATCVQCHAPESVALKSFHLPQPLNLNQFWEVSASIVQEASRRQLPAARSKSDFFYEEADGTVTMAKPGMTLSVDGRATSAHLQDWILQSPEVRGGVVELIWKKAYFQPLVPSFGLAENESAEERKDLKKLLSNQLQATGNIKDIVSALLASDTIRTQDASLTSQWYLRAPSSVLQEYHKRARHFSLVPSPARRLSINTPASQSLVSSQQVIRWLDGSGKGSDSAQLAQPDNSALRNSQRNMLPGNSARSGEAASDLADDQLLFLLSIAEPYTQLGLFADRVSKSGLAWNDQVNHIYMMLEGRLASTNELSDAKRLYDHNGQDSRKSLVQLFISRFGSY